LWRLSRSSLSPCAAMAQCLVLGQSRRIAGFSHLDADIHKMYGWYRQSKFTL
jgi:hypothetical protein